MLDSGSDATCISFKAAKAAAAQILPSEAKTVVITQKIGIGVTNKNLKALVLKVPVPISLNSGAEDSAFDTTSRVGTSDIDDVLGPGFDQVNMNAMLGLPFLLQFQRVTIDYPNHSLILQYPAHDTPIKEASALARHDRAWPGYKWLQRGYAWIEVPDGKTAPSSPAPFTAPSQTAATQTTTVTQTTGTRTTTILPLANDGTVTAIVNGVKSVYPFAPGSGVKIDTDGSVHIVPPPGGGPVK